VQDERETAQQVLSVIRKDAADDNRGRLAPVVVDFKS
jgi:hypothetical protein